MRADRPSFTASFVAMVRASLDGAPADFDLPVDPYAHKLVPFYLRPLSRLLARSWRWPTTARRLVDKIFLGLVEPLALRTAAIDAAILEAAAPQLVLLGAGLDARAYRMRELGGVDVFEVDHPATQAYKRARIGAARPRARSLVYVAVDFERESLDACLARAGHRAEVPTFFLLEGVSMYLHAAALDGTLAAVAARAAAGSRLALTYLPPAAFDRLSRVRTLAHAVLSGIGEPFVGLVTRDDLHARLARFGFGVRSDDDAVDWARRFWPAGVPAPPSAERLAVAVYNTQPMRS